MGLLGVQSAWEQQAGEKRRNKVHRGGARERKRPSQVRFKLAGRRAERARETKAHEVQTGPGGGAWNAK